jgi:hypothetical protein
VIPFLYDTINCFSEGLCGVFKDGKAGIIDKQGNRSVHLSMMIYSSLAKDLFVFAKMKKCGFIDALGNEVIPFIYDRSEGVKCKESDLYR